MKYPYQHRVALTLLLGALLASLRVFATDYYVDSNGGSDSNSGLGSSAAWQSLAKVNAKIFLPGDRLLFKSTCTWIGSLNPKGSGTAGNPIVIDRYGTGTQPIIHGNGVSGPGATGGAAVYLYNQEYWEINNLEITNYDLAAGYASTADAERRGIHIAAADFGTVDHVYIRNCYIHHIRGTLSATDGDLVAKRTGGIIVETISDSITPTRFNDVLIESNTVTTVRNEGIVAAGNRSGQNDFPGTSPWMARKVTNLIIRGNTISDISKNAMIIRLADATCLVEHNVCFNTATLDTGNTMFTASCDGVVFQFNEGYDNHGGLLGDHDGSMYDADLRSINIKFQYSYSHDNAHGLLWLYPSASGANANIICRYNISRADRGIIFAFSGDSGATASTYIYNNIIYTPANLSPIFFDHRSATHTYYVYNNIFYNESATASYSFGGNDVPTFDYNVFYGQHPAGEPSDAHKLTSNPLLVSPGSGGTGINSLSGYQLQPGSPCIDSGLAIANNGGRDFFGKSVPINSATDRGVNEFLNPNNFISSRFASVTVSSDIPYATVVQTTWSSGSTATVNLALDLYQPTGDTSMGRPVIMWLHGGGFRQSSDKTQSYIVDYCNEFAKRGYVCISIEYRRRFTDADGHADADVASTPEYAALQDATRDARYALDWIRANAGTYRIDPNLIFIAGGSAGGRTCQTVSQFPGPDTSALYFPDTAHISDWNKAGIIANATLWGGLEVPMRGWTYPYLTTANVNNILPTLLVHGTADTTIDPQNSIDLDNAITAAGGTSELHLISGAGHTPTSYNSSIIPWIANFFASEWTKILTTTPPANTPPSITGQPQNQSVSEGANVIFTVTATGSTPFSYQWRKAGATISDANSASLTLNAVTTADAANYDVLVSNAYGSAASASATLTVTAGGAPGKVVIAEIYPGGGKSGATYQRDFVVLKNTGGSPVSLNGWSLQHDKGGVWQTPLNLPSASLPAGGYFLIQCYYDGSTASGATLPTPDATTSQSSAWNLSSTVAGSIALVNNTSILTSCSAASIVDLVGYVSTSGNCYEGTGVAPTGSATQSIQRLNTGCQDTGNNSADFGLGAPAPRNSATVPVSCGVTCTAPSITAQPVNQTTCEGSTATFSVTATGTSLTYQWQLSVSGGAFANISGATSSSYTTPATVAGNSGNRYQCLLNGACGAATSNPATLTVNARPTSVVSGTATICSGGATTLQAALTGTGPWNVTWSDGFIQNSVATSPMTRSASPSLSTTYTITALTDANCAAQGSDRTGSAVVTVNTAPSITGQPQSQTVSAGSSASFSVTATGTSLTYQWQLSVGGGSFNDISSATSASYTTPSTTGGDSGNLYRCLVSSACGSPVTSSPATLTVIASSLPAPWLTADIGAVGVVGDASASALQGPYTVKGSGAGITGTADQFRYVYQTLSGDGSITARITSQSGTVSSALAGVMIRETTTAGSRFGLMARQGAGNKNMLFRRRTSTGGNVSSTTGSSLTTPNCWVRITRAGNSIQMLRSSDGVSWSSVNTSNITMASEITIGILVTSGSNTVLDIDVFDNVIVVP